MINHVFIVLHVFQALCKKLRLHGVDSVGIESVDHYEMAGTIAKDQDRAILTKGNRVTTFCTNYTRSGVTKLTKSGRVE